MKRAPLPTLHLISSTSDLSHIPPLHSPHVLGSHQVTHSLQPRLLRPSKDSSAQNEKDLLRYEAPNRDAPRKSDGRLFLTLTPLFSMTHRMMVPRPHYTRLPDQGVTGHARVTSHRPLKGKGQNPVPVTSRHAVLCQHRTKKAKAKSRRQAQEQVRSVPTVDSSRQRSVAGSYTAQLSTA
jgi:hypothetical protein